MNVLDVVLMHLEIRMISAVFAFDLSSQNKGVVSCLTAHATGEGTFGC